MSLMLNALKRIEAKQAPLSVPRADGCWPRRQSAIACSPRMACLRTAEPTVDTMPHRACAPNVPAASIAHSTGSYALPECRISLEATIESAPGTSSPQAGLRSTTPSPEFDDADVADAGLDPR